MIKIFSIRHTIVTDGRVRRSLSCGGANSSEESCKLEKHVCDSTFRRDRQLGYPKYATKGGNVEFRRARRRVIAARGGEELRLECKHQGIQSNPIEARSGHGQNSRSIASLRASCISG